VRQLLVVGCGNAASRMVSRLRGCRRIIATPGRRGSLPQQFACISISDEQEKTGD